jgi:hypothetical protein
MFGFRDSAPSASEVAANGMAKITTKKIHRLRMKI